jgi:acetyltransferase-like isoleucine patch superfamily enzyme
MTERERMDAGLWYDANFDDELARMRLDVKTLAHELNSLGPKETTRHFELLRRIVGKLGDGCEILTPFMVDYGYNVSIGEGSFINHDSYLMDCAPITIGSHVFIGPRFGAYTALHPLDAEQGNSGIECAKPITICDNCWFGGNVTILPGITIGEGCVIGAGSVVTRDIPAHSLAFGSPCRVIRAITDADRIDPEDRP